MLITKAYRYELKPNVAQRILLAKHAGAARFAYNWGLGRRIKQYERDKTSSNGILQHKELNAIKKTELPWMYEVSKCAAQEALRDLDRAYQNFFRGLKQGKKIGFPKFRKKGQNDRFRLTGTIKVLEKSIQLPRLESVRLKERARVSGRILSATVSREADRWFASLTVEQEILEPQKISGEAVGVDVGLNAFATYSNGTKILSPKPLNKNLRRLKKLSKQHSRKVKGSNNRKKMSLKLARLHCRVKNIRTDHLHQTSSQLAKTKSVIILEDLAVSGMVQNSRLSRHIADAGWGEFRRQLEYKCQWYGSKLVIAPRFFPSSKLCSNCGVKREVLKLHERQWTCETCGTQHDRDINAAKNLLSWSTVSSTEINACRESSGGVVAKPQLAMVR